MKYVFPLRQHVGAPSKPLVKPDDLVKRGQLIAELNGLGANIHTSVSGRVTAVDDASIVIEADNEQPDTFVPLTAESPLELIKQAGIVGAGGAGFPTHVKLGKPIPHGTVIANAAECEPLLHHNIQFIEDHPDVIIRGIKIIMDIVQADTGYIVIKTKHLKAVTALGKACKGLSNISVKILPDMYPAGDERVIIREILGIVLEPGALPSTANAVISNVETIKNIVQAVELKRPVITKDITVGGLVKNPSVFLDVPLGATVQEYIDKCGGYVEPHGEIVLGGPFTGKHGEPDAVIVKTLGGILVSMPFPQETRKMGIIGCECGAGIDRLKQIAAGMGAQVVAETTCKRMVDVNGRLRCDLPGVCPGQAEKVLFLKKNGAEVILTGTCED